MTKALRAPRRHPPKKPPREAGAAAGRAEAAFETGGLPGRGHAEELPDGTTHRTGIWIVNQKQRRDRLTPEQLGVLADLGIPWATP
ncbi:hypothetical protein ACIBEA_41610 [Streptomyces sp. NPDC051555]|uniref:hypothetical protein n=1 Tax=Streptomyces sp. NPDC051555 TaxID=3365657 RepID=UPI00378CB687